MTAARYWRIRISTNGGGAYACVPEMEFRIEPGGSDYCQPGQSQSSGNYSSTYVANNAVNNDTTTAWISTNGVVSGTWVDNDISSGGLGFQEIREVAITATPSSWLTAMPRTGVIDYSTDRVEWVAHTPFTLAAWTTAGQVQTIAVGSAPEPEIPNDVRFYGAQAEMWDVGPAATPARIYGAQAEMWDVGPADTPARFYGAHAEMWATVLNVKNNRRRRPVHC